jgi:polyisoprenoid-binding protein YceI
MTGVKICGVGALAAFILAYSAWAQAPAPPPSGVYRLDTSRTKILFGVRLLGLTTQYGAFSGVTGTLNLESDDPAASRLEIHAPTATVVAPSHALDGTIKGPKWLDVATFPEMIYRATAITPTGRNTVDVTGDLTLHGVTHPLVLHAHIKAITANALDLEARGRLNRTDYGVSTRVPLLGDEVEVILGAVFERAP